jgi:hypothetical protein
MLYVGKAQVSYSLFLPYCLDSFSYPCTKGQFLDIWPFLLQRKHSILFIRPSGALLFARPTGTFESPVSRLRNVYAMSTRPSSYNRCIAAITCSRKRILRSSRSTLLRISGRRPFNSVYARSCSSVISKMSSSNSLM